MARRSGQRGGSVDPAAAYIAAMQTAPSAAVGDAIRDLIYGLITDGLWRRFALFYLTNLATEQASRLNAVDPRRNALTDVGTAPTWASGVGGAGGFTPNGAALDTGWHAGQAGLQFVGANSAMWAIRSWTNTLSTNGDFGDATRLQGRLHTTSGATTCRIQDGTTTTLASPGDGSGLFAGDRSGFSTKELFRNGASIGSDTTSGGGVTASTFHIGGINGSTIGARRLSFCAVGASLVQAGGAAAHASLYTRLTAFETAIGAT